MCSKQLETMLLMLRGFPAPGFAGIKERRASGVELLCLILELHISNNVLTFLFPIRTVSWEPQVCVVQEKTDPIYELEDPGLSPCTDDIVAISVMCYADSNT